MGRKQKYLGKIPGVCRSLLRNAEIVPSSALGDKDLNILVKNGGNNPIKNN